jgi:NADP-dependent 3-hydroxy acid dehydrogenase YdfG
VSTLTARSSSAHPAASGSASRSLAEAGAEVVVAARRTDKLADLVPATRART